MVSWVVRAGLYESLRLVFNPDMFKQKGIRVQDSAGLCGFGLMLRACGYSVYGSGYKDRCA